MVQSPGAGHTENPLKSALRKSPEFRESPTSESAIPKTVDFGMRTCYQTEADKESAMTKSVAIYSRVSTDRQTTENQERELRAVAERMGWRIVQVYCDEGISGAKGRKDRPAFDALCKDAARRRFDLVMAWSVDRLGRSVCKTLSPSSRTFTATALTYSCINRASTRQRRAARRSFR